jgi:hypothetical protein
MSAVKALLERMDTHPEEFINDDYSCTAQTFGNMFNETRWEYVSWAMSGDVSKFGMFTPEEHEAYLTKVGKLMRQKFEADVCAELLNPSQPEQMELFPNQSSFPPRSRTKPNSIITSTTMLNEALKIFNDEVDKGRTKAVMNDPTGHIL